MQWKLEHFEYDPVFADQSEVRDSAGRFVCRIENCPSPTIARQWVGDSLVGVTDSERLLWERNLANARLIAAAPDLLAALQRLVHPMADDDDLETALSVIARATGAP
jgi:hypothetical protein